VVLCVRNEAAFLDDCFDERAGWAGGEGSRLCWRRLKVGEEAAKARRGEAGEGGEHGEHG